LTLTFTKQADVVGPPAVVRTWVVSASAAPNGPVGFTPAAGTTFTFDSSGNLTAPASDLTLDITMGNGAANLSLVWDLVDASGPLGDVTGYAAPSNTTFQSQDGYGSGVLRGITVNESGVVTAAYSNGQLTPVFQIAMADFPNFEGLAKLGKNLYSESINSGQPLPGVAGDGRLGSITPMAIEMSNVDLAQEFVKMITTQRAFQANSRVITTSDEILAELINLKR
jgi:flagellar hook protein FlgE